MVVMGRNLRLFVRRLRNGKLRLNAAWRCRGFDQDAAKAWIDEQLDEKDPGQASSDN